MKKLTTREKIYLGTLISVLGLSTVFRIEQVKADNEGKMRQEKMKDDNQTPIPQPTATPIVEPTAIPTATPLPTPQLKKYEEPKYGYVVKEVKLKNGKIKLPMYQTVKMLGKLKNKVLVKCENKEGYINSNKVVELNDTFVTIDVDKQELRIIEDGKTTLKTSVVTGTETNESRRSDRGVFEVYSKSADRYLQGPGYSTHVDYFAAYNNGEGLHDACWRDSFGGDIYKYNGSHGCINLPVDVAPKVYKKVKIGTKVIVHD